jgi:N-acetylmuramoyl-L-alanine amidase
MALLFMVVCSGAAFASQATVPPVLDLASVKNQVIIIDPAHGGKDTGVNCRGILEKDITLKAAKIIRKKLEKNDSGVKVYLTRENDMFLSAAERAGIGNNRKGTVYISIHCDYAASPKAEGYKVYYSRGTQKTAKRDASAVLEWRDMQSYYIDESAKLAGYISQYLRESLIAEPGISSDGTNSTIPNAYRKENSASLVSLEGVDMPAVVIELGNLNNKNDAGFLKDEKVLNSMCYHIKEALLFFLKNRS